MTINEEWLSSEDTARYLGYSYHHFMHEIKTDPGFPKPSRRQTAKGYGHPKWRRSELDAWLLGNIKAA
jgi:predicted DNA-binding transcriptional regulator AlpA